MKKLFLLALPVWAIYLVGNVLFAQTTGTFIVTDNGNRAYSCQDTLVSLVDIIKRTGIRDLNDPNDNPGLYRMLRLEGSIITSDVIAGSIKYTDYAQVYIEKTGTPFNGHNGVVVYMGMIQRPTTFFKKDTLKPYTVEKGATVNYTQDFFNNFEFWDSGFDTETLQNRLIFVDEENHISEPIGNHWTVGKGTYKVKIKAAVCGPNDLMWDSVYVIVKETPCLRLEIKDLPSVCSDDLLDITPYLQVDGSLASVSQLAAMTFSDRSNVLNPSANGILNPHSLNMTTMLDGGGNFPSLEIAYQPNIEQGVGVCANYNYRIATKVPFRYLNTPVVFLKDNAGTMVYRQIDGDYYGFNNSFNKNVLSKMFLDYYDALDGTIFRFFTQQEYKEVVGSTLSPGDYNMWALNPSCNADTSFFGITIKNRDFDIQWQSTPTQGKGYFTFTAPIHSDASYAWSVYGGTLVRGGGTNEIVVYFSENVSSSVTVSCQITLAAARLADGALTSVLYFDSKEGKPLDQLIVLNTPLDQTFFSSPNSVYPNPGTGTFAISGTGTYDLKVYNSLGQVVHQDASYIANSALSLDTKGMHIVYLTQNGNRQSLKVMVQ